MAISTVCLFPSLSVAVSNPRCAMPELRERVAAIVRAHQCEKSTTIDECDFKMGLGTMGAIALTGAAGLIVGKDIYDKKKIRNPSYKLCEFQLAQLKRSFSNIAFLLLLPLEAYANQNCSDPVPVVRAKLQVDVNTDIGKLDQMIEAKKAEIENVKVTSTVDPAVAQHNSFIKAKESEISKLNDEISELEAALQENKNKVFKNLNNEPLFQKSQATLSALKETHPEIGARFELELLQVENGIDYSEFDDEKVFTSKKSEIDVKFKELVVSEMQRTKDPQVIEKLQTIVKGYRDRITKYKGARKAIDDSPILNKIDEKRREIHRIDVSLKNTPAPKPSISTQPKIDTQRIQALNTELTNYQTAQSKLKTVSNNISKNPKMGLSDIKQAMQNILNIEELPHGSVTTRSIIDGTNLLEGSHKTKSFSSGGGIAKGSLGKTDIGLSDLRFAALKKWALKQAGTTAATAGFMTAASAANAAEAADVVTTVLDPVEMANETLKNGVTEIGDGKCGDMVTDEFFLRDPNNGCSYLMTDEIVKLLTEEDDNVLIAFCNSQEGGNFLNYFENKYYPKVSQVPIRCDNYPLKFSFRDSDISVEIYDNTIQFSGLKGITTVAQVIHPTDPKKDKLKVLSGKTFNQLSPDQFNSQYQYQALALNQLKGISREIAACCDLNAPAVPSENDCNKYGVTKNSFKTSYDQRKPSTSILKTK